MAYENILYDVEDRLATITFNRPERRNAINWDMSAEISAALKAAEVDTDVSVIILKGAGEFHTDSGPCLNICLSAPPGVLEYSQMRTSKSSKSSPPVPPRRMARHMGTPPFVT